MQEDLEKLLINAQKEVSKSNKIKDRIIIVLIVCMFLQAVCFFTGFVYYESQFTIAETSTDEVIETSDVDIITSGDNANAEYNDVNGNQYNDSSTHNDSGGDK